MGITRRETLIAGMAGVAGFVASKIPFGEAPKNTVDSAHYFYDAPASKNFLEHVLVGFQVEELRDAIKTYFNSPFQRLSDLERVTVDNGVYASTDIMTKRKNLRWVMRGTHLEGDLGRHLFLGGYVALEPNQGISRVTLYTDLQKTFGTGLTPEIDPYIDTTHGARIAEKDLPNVADAVFTNIDNRIFPYIVKRGWNLKQEDHEKYVQDEGRTRDGMVERKVLEDGSAVLTITQPFYTPREFY